MITITDAARNKIISVLNEENSNLIRFGLQGGGCNGFQYYFSIEEKREDDDLEFILDDKHTLLIDSMSNMYLDDAEIDYKKDLMGESFIFKNPNQKTSCGCGQSVGFD